MRVYFEQIKIDGLDVETSFEFDISSAHIVVKSFIGKIYPMKNAYFLDGAVEFSVRDKCDRCTDMFERDFNERIQVEIVRNRLEEDEEEKELTEEDLSYYNVIEDFVDIDRIVKEEVTLLKPMKWLCHESCKGICPECGADLNKEVCSCNLDTIDPRFEILKKLKNG